MPSAPKSRSRKRKLRVSRPKTCRLCEDRVLSIEYKQTEILRRYVTEKGKILPRRITGNCPRHQKMLAKAIKRARNIALMN